MSSLKSYEKIIFEKLFDRGGYVLDFNDRTFAEFFREFSININLPKYQINGTSKMKRLRAFWEIEPDTIVGNVFDGLLKCAEAIQPVSEADKTKAQEIINRLLGKRAATK